MESRLNGAALAIGIGTKVSEFGLEDFVWIAWHANMRRLPFLQLRSEMLRHAGAGFHHTEVHNFDQRLIRRDGLPHCDVHLRNHACHRSCQHDLRRRITGLTAFHPHQCLPLSHHLIGERHDRLGTAWNATTHDGTLPRQHLDATEREYGFFEDGLFGFDGLDTKVLHAGFIKDDRVGEAFLLVLGERVGGDGKGKSDEQTSAHKIKSGQPVVPSRAVRMGKGVMMRAD